MQSENIDIIIEFTQNTPFLVGPEYFFIHNVYLYTYGLNKIKICAIDIK